MEFASIRLITRDVARLADFYELVTGLEASRPVPVFAEIRTARATLAIADPATVGMLGAAAPEPGGASGVIIEFLVGDVDARFAQLSPSLTDIVLEPTTMPWGNRSALFRDPDGNLVNLFSRPA
ncbi:VOC family protein [Agromyces sp. MMS24-JH15]|uniref:VOC family protein n=1 Tax=Agromyces sp. MMS24-JH15 TaxID=3243765 RepID=UPI003749AA32